MYTHDSVVDVVLLVSFFLTSSRFFSFIFFFFNDTATTEIYTLSLHDALPICQRGRAEQRPPTRPSCGAGLIGQDRKSTRLNSSHSQISYAVFCLKKKKNNNINKISHYIHLNMMDALACHFALRAAES